MVRTALVAVALALAVGVSTGLIVSFGLFYGSIATGVVLLAVFLFFRLHGDGGAGEVWEFTTAAEQTGRYAESGGIAREEQEQALQEIDERADELDGE